MAESLRFRLKNPNAELRETAAMELVFAPDGEYLSELLDLLKDQDLDVKRTAVLALGALNDQSALTGLRDVLLDPDLELATIANNAISKFGSTGRNYLLDWLDSPDWPNRAAALRNLTAEANPDFSQTISKLTQDLIWEVRYEAYLLLGRIPDLQSLNILKQSFQVEQHDQAREAIISALGSIQIPEACEILIQNFVDPFGSEFAQSLASALSHYGTLSHDLLLEEGLWSPDPEIRSLSAALLADTGCQDLKQYLQPLLLDPEVSVRQTVAYALFQTQTDQPFWEFIAGIYHPEKEVFLEALDELTAYPEAEIGQRILESLELMLLSERIIPMILALGKIAYEPASAALVELLEILPDKAEQMALCSTLGHLRAWRAYRPLQKLLGHPDLDIQTSAAKALFEINPLEPEWQDILNLETLSIKIRQKRLKFLVAHPEARGLMVKLAIETDKPDLRAHIIDAMSTAGAKELKYFIEHWLNHHPEPEAETVGAILQGIRVVGLSLKMAYTLIKWLKSREEETRLQVVHLLQMERIVLQESLLNLSYDELWFVRQAALMVLGAQSHPLIVKRLREALSDRDRDVCITAVTLLGEISSLESQDPLIEALENGYRDIRAAAARALGKQKAIWAIEPLEIALVEDEAADVRRACAEALSEIEHEDMVDLLEEALQHEDDSEAYATYLKLLHKHDPSSAAPWVFEALSKPEPSILLEALNIIHSKTSLSEDVLSILQKLMDRSEDIIRTKALTIVLKHMPDEARKWLLISDPLLQLTTLQALSPKLAETLQGELFILKDSDEALVRQGVFRAMARTPSLWPLLIHQASQEPDSSVQHILVELLTDLPPEQISEAMFILLSKGTIQLQTSVTWAMIQLMEQGESALLLQALQSQLDEQLRSTVFKHLGKMGEQALAILETLTESWDRSLMLMATRTLGDLGKVALPILSRQWQSGEMTIQIAVLDALKKIHDPAVIPLLTEVTQSPLDNLRAHAFETITLLGPSAEPSLKKLAVHELQSVRYDACRSLALLNPTDSVWIYLQGINSILPHRRLQNLLGLQELYHDEHLTYFWHLRHDPAYQIRKIFSETKVSNQKFWRNWLYKTLLTDVLPVRIGAIQALSCYPISEEEKLNLVSIWPQAPVVLKEALLAVLCSLGLPGQAMEALSSHSPWLRVSAATALGYYKLTAAQGDLESVALKDLEPEVRANAIWSLGYLNQKPSLKIIEETIHDPNQMIKFQSIVALGHLSFEESAMLLLKFLQSNPADVELIEEVLRGLAKHRYEQAVPDIISFTLLNNDPDLKYKALIALKNIPSTRAQAYLLETANGPEPVLASKAKALLEI